MKVIVYRFCLKKLKFGKISEKCICVLSEKYLKNIYNKNAYRIPTKISEKYLKNIYAYRIPMKISEKYLKVEKCLSLQWMQSGL